MVLCELSARAVLSKVPHSGVLNMEVSLGSGFENRDEIRWIYWACTLQLKFLLDAL